MFVVVNFDALAQASDIQIERRQVVFLCWKQDSNPEGIRHLFLLADWMPADKPTELSRIKLKNFTYIHIYIHTWYTYIHTCMHACMHACIYAMLCYAMIWYDMIWYHVMWCDVIWYDMIYDMICRIISRMVFAHYRAWDLCRIPEDATKTKAGLSGTWGVPDKNRWGLGSMSQYSTQIWICCTANIFPFFYSSVGLVMNLAGLPPCTLPLSIAIRMRLLNAKSNLQHTLLRHSRVKTFSGIYATALVRLADKMDETCINVHFSVHEPRVWRGVFAHLWIILVHFNPEPRLISGVLELGQVVWKMH